MRKILLLVIAVVLVQSMNAVSFMAKDGVGLKTFPGDIRSRSMGLTGIVLSGDMNSSVMNPSTSAKQKVIVFGFGETISSTSLSYERFSGFSADETSIDAPYINIIFPLPLKNTVLTLHYYAPLNSYFQGNFSHTYPHPDEVSDDITDFIDVEYYKNINIIGFSGAYAFPFNLSLSLGFECAFGNDKTEYTILNTAFTHTKTEIESVNKFLGYAPRIGAYYSWKEFVVGAVYRPSYNIDVTTMYNSLVLPDYLWKYPTELNFGIGYTNKDMTLSIEYINESWGDTSYLNYGKTEDLTRIGIGAEYLLGLDWKIFTEKEKKVTIPLRAGYYTQNGLYQNGKESAFSFGTSIRPFRSANAAVDLMISFGSREMDLNDVASSGVVSRYTEDFITFGVSFTTKDLWFREKKK